MDKFISEEHKCMEVINNDKDLKNQYEIFSKNQIEAQNESD